MICEPCKSLLSLPLLNTESSHFLAVFRHPRAGVSTNVFLRVLHNRALDMGWILHPVLVKRLWPKIRYKKRRGIRLDEHQKLVESEWDQEWRLYYEMLWHTGGAQSDIACLHRDNVDAERGILCYTRMKLRECDVAGATLIIGEQMRAILEQLPQEGYLFPRLKVKGEMDRACRFRKRCLALGISGVTLHCYRYAWVERACEAGMPEREAMAHLGHNSAAVHRDYARKACSLTLPLEYYENRKQTKIVPFASPPHAGLVKERTNLIPLGLTA